MAKRGDFRRRNWEYTNLTVGTEDERQMEEQAKEMETKEFTATAGGRAEVTVSGTKKVLKVKPGRGSRRSG